MRPKPLPLNYMEYSNVEMLYPIAYTNRINMAKEFNIT